MTEHASGEEAIESALHPEYLVFDSYDAATSWFDRMRTTFGPQLTALFGPLGPVASEDEPESQRAHQLVAAHWNTIVPLFAPGIPQPRVIVVQGSVPNAAVLYDPNIKKTGNVIVIATALLTQPDQVVSAIIAHELGHLTLKNVDPAHNQRTYYAAVHGEPLGITQADDPVIRTTFTSWLKTAATYGVHPLIELGGIPIASELSRVLGAYVQSHLDLTRPSCTTFQDAVMAMNRARATGVYDDIRVTFEARQLALLDAARGRVEASAVDCLQPTSAQSAIDLYAQMFGVSPPALSDAMHPDDVAASSGASDPLTGIFAMTRLARERMRATQAAHDFNSFRIYTNEDQADDFAMTILYAAGMDPRDMGRALLAIAPPAIVRQGCDTILSAGQVPKYGLLGSHPPVCFRAYHANAFASYLEAGGVGVTGTVVPRGPRRPDARSFDPMLDRLVND